MLTFRLLVGAAAAVALLLAGCPKTPPTAPTDKGRAAAPATSELVFNFKDAKPSANPQHLVRLDYELSAPDGPQPMQLTDPKEPQGAEVRLELCTIRSKPFVCEPRISKQGQSRCKVNCVYTLCVRGADGAHLGDFEINDWGALVLKSDTVAPGLDYELMASSQRQMYFYYRENSGGSRDLLLALEYLPNAKQTLRELTASDGWHYTFWAPDGRLLVHSAQSISGLAEEIANLSTAERAGRAEELKDWAQRNKQQCASGGG